MNLSNIYKRHYCTILSLVSILFSLHTRPSICSGIYMNKNITSLVISSYDAERHRPDSLVRTIYPVLWPLSSWSDRTKIPWRETTWWPLSSGEKKVTRPLCSLTSHYARPLWSWSQFTFLEQPRECDHFVFCKPSTKSFWMFIFLLFNKVCNRPPPWRRDWHARHWWSHYPPHPLYDCYLKNPGKPRKLDQLFPTLFLGWSSCGSASLNRDPNWLTHWPTH